MPVFEYQCRECRKRFSLLVGVVAEPSAQVCPSCGSADIGKLISRFSRVRSEDDVIESLADPSKIGDPENPRDMADWMKRMGREMGEDLGDDFDEMLAGDEGETELE
jgi:putative FmdB family regulatory protein